MADELVLYTNPMSRGRVARWMLEEIGEPYKVEVVDYASTMKGPAYLAINPMGKVPALRHGDAVVTETAAICAYLADAFPQARLAPPPGDRLRAPASNKALGFVVPPERERMMGYGNFAKTISTLEAAIASVDYLVGNRFSSADLYVGAQIGFGMMFGTLEKRPAFERYWQRMSARPAYARATQLDDEKAAELKKAAG